MPTSSVLDGLQEAFTPSGPTRYGAWWSPCDDAIVPHANAELPGAQHAFDVFHSIRSAHVIRGVERFLRWVHATRDLSERGSGDFPVTP